MRALKTILIILGALLALFVILGLIASKDYRYERSISIAASPDVVYSHVNSLAAMDKWSPWNDYDPNMQKSIEGEDGQVGAVAKWEGNSDVGKGEQRIDSLVENQLMKTKLKFLEPWEQESIGRVELAESGDGTNVTWSISGENNFVGRVFGMFMDMDAMIGKDFEKGLQRLDSMVGVTVAQRQAEREALLARFQITVTDRSSTTYAGVRETVKWADLKAFFGKAFGATGAALGAAHVKPAGMPTAVFFKWDEVNMEADLLAGMPIPVASKAKVSGVITYETPASKAYTVAYLGGYSGMEPAHQALAMTLEADGMELNGNVLEEYVTDPGSEPDSLKWQTNITWLAKPKATANQ